MSKQFKTTMVGAEVLAVLEERTKVIKDQQLRIASLQHEIDLRDSTIRSLKTSNEDYQKAMHEGLAKIAQLNGIIATMDTKAIEKERQRSSEELKRKDQEIERLKEDVHRALGWIAAQRSEHPIHWSSRPKDLAPFDKRAERHVMAMQGEPEDQRF